MKTALLLCEGEGIGKGGAWGRCPVPGPVKQESGHLPTEIICSLCEEPVYNLS